MPKLLWLETIDYDTHALLTRGEIEERHEDFLRRTTQYRYMKRKQMAQKRAAEMSEDEAYVRYAEVKAELEKYRKALCSISLTSVNSSSTREECGRIAREALATESEQPIPDSRK